LKYDLKKLKSLSDEPSGSSEDARGLKRDIHCLKYELKKLKSVSNENPVVEESVKLKLQVRVI
jgi:hypothetical protein